MRRLHARRHKNPRQHRLLHAAGGVFPLRERDVFRALDQGFLDADRAEAFYDEGLFLNERIHYTLDFGFHSYTCSICGHLQQQKEKEFLIFT